MFKRMLLVFVSTVVMCSAPVHAASLDVPQVEKLIASFDNAVVKHSGEEMGKHLSENFKYAGTANFSGKKAPTTQNKADFLRSFKEAVAGITGYQFRRTDVRIDLAADKKSALVHSKTFELSTFPDRTLTANGTGTTKVELVQDKPMITSIVEEMKLR